MQFPSFFYLGSNLNFSLPNCWALCTYTFHYTFLYMLSEFNAGIKEKQELENTHFKGIAFNSYIVFEASSLMIYVYSQVSQSDHIIPPE